MRTIAVVHQFGENQGLSGLVTDIIELTSLTRSGPPNYAITLSGDRKSDSTQNPRLEGAAVMRMATVSKPKRRKNAAASASNHFPGSMGLCYLNLELVLPVTVAALSTSVSLLARRSLMLRPAHSSGPQIRDPLSEGFSNFVTLAVPVASWPHRVLLFGRPRSPPHGRHRLPLSMFMPPV
jgi:hypothetical protein